MICLAPSSRVIALTVPLVPEGSAAGRLEVATRGGQVVAHEPEQLLFPGVAASFLKV